MSNLHLVYSTKTTTELLLEAGGPKRPFMLLTSEAGPGWRDSKRERREQLLRTRDGRKEEDGLGDSKGERD